MSNLSNLFTDFNSLFSPATDENTESAEEWSQESSNTQVVNKKDPYALDPCFETEKDMIQYLADIGQTDVVITSDEIEINIGEYSENKHCDCHKCEDIKIRGGRDYLCCNQLFLIWKQDCAVRTRK